MTNGFDVEGRRPCRTQTIYYDVTSVFRRDIVIATLYRPVRVIALTEFGFTNALVEQRPGP